eukprot:TRINITY_DN182_c0_g1_i8.p1 TRINITY_DN182_c0_g1~~TRINITY_DN182_c0_g1_i8.p1  ORF type:complete len:256 (-),score=45.05 TRINITY_DN182_c0_g1_i8:95-862(-)
MLSLSHFSRSRGLVGVKHTRQVYTNVHKNKKVAVVLSGCGVYDGSEIHEAVSVLLAISQNGATYSCFAPSVPQHHVVDHSTESVQEGVIRDVLQEAARIARGSIKDLEDCHADHFDALIFPGGFGVAKNLSDYAFTEKGEMTVHPHVESVIKAFHVQKKPIGLCCIAPVLAAKVLPGSKVTVGSDVGTIERISAMGSTTTVCNVEEVVIDKNNLLVTTPAYMLDQPIHKVYEGITKLVKNVLQLTPLKANDESSK